MNCITAEHDSPRLLDMVRREIRYRRYALSTEKADVQWVREFVTEQARPSGNVIMKV